ncbi:MULTISPECIES: antibiotic biosynthesis monooxygenase [Nitrobacteraceae]|uniref:putative quinol monooxygenase n=1 Tax=Afipia birgiae TaxID=151414 RepID=UPI0018D23A1B|nr:antibiotic biosynthesis monooxygenase [Afipia birgiae]
MFAQNPAGRGSWTNASSLSFAPSRAEQGCINYDLHRSTEDPELWCVYENWRSADDLAAHFELLAPI